MKIALLSDIHANRQAFDACLAHARAQGAQQIALLGDLVGYGAAPRYVVQQAMALAAEGAHLVGGNHDAMAVRPPVAGERGAGSVVAQSADWTYAQLSAEEHAFLAALPLTAELGSVLLVHASADAPERWRYVDNPVVAADCLHAALQRPGIAHVFCGHVHRQMLYYRGAGHGLMRFVPTPGVAVPVPPHRPWVATVGSVGQPRDGDPRAMYALLDTAAWRLTFERVPYDHAGAAAAIRATGALSEFFAQRLEVGQ
ncbi:metallophosphatase family protein [Acidovorax sp. SRB_14]|uniref:metallophosphoesterase family protein n=1 Tax=Acidovorax sp. SRB_14 TaxID=1962699 RepID=UPI0015638A11|nr:metallophosphoesterase family protein [Acidovorax sp. SRB_14]NMM81430.1 metallophosphatase family protein [Acidovorax sp. SRB_14]